MKTRLITGAILVAALLPILYFSDLWFFPIVVSVLCVIGLFEMFRCLSSLSFLLLTIPSFLIGAAGPILARLMPDKKTFFSLFLGILVVYLFFLFCVFVFSYPKIPLDVLSSTVLTSLYIICGFTSLVVLRNNPHGGYFIFLAVFAPWVGDVFAYLIGRAFGKHKLIPLVSPKKTVEGSVASIVFTILFCFLYAFLVSTFYDKTLQPDWIGLVLVGILLSVVGQIGDLITSAIKRTHDIKDYGRIFPGHGGVLDRFDSVLSTGIFLLLFSLFSDTVGIFKG